MAADGGNAPITPHTRRQIDGRQSPEQAEIMGGVWPSKCSFVPAMMMMHPRNIGVWMRDIHTLNP